MRRKNSPKPTVAFCCQSETSPWSLVSSVRFNQSGSYGTGLRKKVDFWVNLLADKREEPIEGSDG
jgi:hypothetical protein